MKDKEQIRQGLKGSLFAGTGIKGFKEAAPVTAAGNPLILRSALPLATERTQEFPNNNFMNNS